MAEAVFLTCDLQEKQRTLNKINKLSKTVSIKVKKPFLLFECYDAALTT